MSDSLASEILDLLSREREAISAAVFDDIAAMTDEKASLLEKLARYQVPPNQLTAIKSALAENQTLLAASMKGVRSAIERLAALDSVSKGLQVYDRSGQFSKVATSQSSLEKKA